MTFNKRKQYRRMTTIKSALLAATSVILLAACKTTAPVVEKKAPTPAPKPVKTYKTFHIGSNNQMILPSSWSLVSGFMPKNYVRYTVKANGVHMVITGFKSPKNRFSMSKSRKELDSKTLLYWSSASNKQKNYIPLISHHKQGEYVQYSCSNGKKCYQVFPLSNWNSVVVSELQAGDMKYNITAGVNNLSSEAAQDVIKGLRSIKAL